MEDIHEYTFKLQISLETPNQTRLMIIKEINEYNLEIIALLEFFNVNIQSISKLIIEIVLYC